MNYQHDITEEELLTIERYLRNEMSDLERMQFLLQLNRDQSLREKTEATRLMSIGIAEAALEEKLNSFHKDEVVIRRISPVRKWAIAAAVATILILSVTWLLTRPSENEKIFSQYFQPDPGLVTSMGVSDDYRFNRAMVDYKAGKYNEAIIAWKLLLNQDPQNDTLNYFIGSAFLANDEVSESIPFLEQVSVDKESIFNEDAVWYLALAYVKTGMNEKAIAILESNPGQKNASLLDKLKK